MSTAIMLGLVATAAVVFTFGLVLLSRSTYKYHHMRTEGDVETTYVTAVSTLYGIFMAFMIFIVWSKYSDARQAAAAEANDVSEVYHLAGGQGPAGDRIQDLALRYARSVANHEWKSMANGRRSDRTERTVRDMWKQLNQMEEGAVRDEVVRDHLLSSWIHATDMRQLRLGWASTEFPAAGYALLIFGGLITLGLASLFMAEDLTSHVVKASALGAMIAMMMVSIWGLDHPFRGRVHVQPAPFVEILEMLEER